ncbi:DUF222 domain-containing protein [Dactylosporangium sp. NPDC049525]|uniref:HNH endonuclease signature motif containing protein n=1 Tax=Dactylosporangium sp. NPDC049525 TaxID=3154730 RepID=UPI00341CFE84
MDAVLAVVDSALGDGPMSEPWAWSDDELGARVDLVYAHLQRVSAAHLAVVREIQGRGLPARQGMTSAAQWLHQRLRITTGLAGRLLRLGQALDSDEHAATADALAAGAVNVEQAEAIVDLLRQLPGQHRAEGESRLLEEAVHSDRHGLRERAGQLLHELDPEEAERREAHAAEREAERAHLARSLTFHDVPGTQQTRVRAVLERAEAALLRETLDAQCGPGRDADAVLRTPRQQRADALMELCRIAQFTGSLPTNGGDRPQVAVIVPFETLLRQSQGSAAQGRGFQGGTAQGSAARLDDGSPISAETARRLACDAMILPVVLGSRGEILDVGREQRLFTTAIRRALALRDGGCAFPGCTRPSRWCDGHHIVHWADHGPTSVDNGVLLCGVHHRLVHHGDWQVRLNPADRLPEFIPPAYIDGARTPRRNTFHPRR